MKSTLKKTLSILLAVTMIFGTVALAVCYVDLSEFPIKAEAAGNYSFSVNSNGEATLLSVNKSISGDVIIPSTAGEYPVTRIDDQAFYSCTKLTSVTIPASIKSIGIAPFKKCDNLASIIVDSENEFYSNDENGVLFNKDKTELVQYAGGIKKLSYKIPDGVIKIADSAFSHCFRFTAIEIPDSVTSIGKLAFYNCISLENIKIGNSVKSIGGAAFSDCTALTSVIIPNSVETIDGEAFENCTKIKSLTIGNGVISIGNAAFSNCDSLTSVIIPDSVTSVDSYPFSGCNMLQSVTLGKGITSISHQMFAACPNLKSISLPDGVTKIEGRAFSGCTSLSKITMSKSVESIAGYAFENCIKLTTINYKGSVKDFKNIIISSGNDYFLNATVNYIYTLTYNPNGGTGAPAAQTGTESYKISSTVPVRDGYTFLGWSKDSAATSASYIAGDIIVLTEDTTLYAVWEKAKGYSLTYNPNGGSGAPATQTGKESYNISSTVPVRDGYTFLGWSKNSSATSASYTIGDTITLTENTTLYAVWKKAENIYNLGEETYSFENFGDADSEYGHCFGMSVTSSGYYINELDITDTGIKNGQTLYSLKSTDKVKKPICYYQQIQDEFSRNSTVAGGSAYLTGKYDINSDWNEVLNYVKNHEYDGKGSLQVGFKGNYRVNGKLCSGGHAINFLRYEEVNGQPRIYVYDCNFPNIETYFYKDSDGNIKQAPKETFDVSITCIALRSVSKYFELAGGYDSTNYIYAPADSITINGATGYIMDGTINGVEYAMYKVPENAEQVIIKPLVDNAEFTYVDESYSFGNVNDDTLGIFTLSSGDHGASNVGLKIVNIGIDIRTPSTTSITYGDSIILHADIEGELPKGAKIVWSADNSNFTYTVSDDGKTCTISPSANGDTVFTASVVDADGKEISSDTQKMTSKAGFFQKLIAFFKKLFGLAKVIPEAFNDII